MAEAKEKTGLVFNIQRDSTEDGPGVRTTVFMKGCTMRCPWCHNPESISRLPELVWHENRCIGDGKCVGVCPNNALSLSPDGIVIDRALCTACGNCADICPSKALEVLGTRMTAQEIAAKVLRDKVFYEKSGGGMTISGGEPGMQSGFAAELMEMMRREGIHIALDTCGGVVWEKLRPLAELADIVLYDLKCLEGDDYGVYTGISKELILENARKISALGKPMWIRTPVIPGYTGSEENIRLIARFIAEHLPTVERYDLLAFNNLCVPKYKRLGVKWQLSDAPAISAERMEALAEAARGEGISFVRWSGMTKK